MPCGSRKISYSGGKLIARGSEPTQRLCQKEILWPFPNLKWPIDSTCSQCLEILIHGLIRLRPWFTIVRFTSSFWELVHGALNPHDELQRKFPHVTLSPSRCILCNLVVESQSHIFINCHFAKLFSEWFEVGFLQTSHMWPSPQGTLTPFSTTFVWGTLSRRGRRSFRRILFELFCGRLWI